MSKELQLHVFSLNTLIFHYRFLIYPHPFGLHIALPTKSESCLALRPMSRSAAVCCVIRQKRAGRAVRPALSLETGKPFRNIHLNDHAYESLHP
jgi:hypothetical protein